ncbi:MAG: T9SS type A sorting domain-containing protein [Bacteroidetes bacterium]|nr:T9SS type A sorting domain-containing protein [Bacteroidota bacterium]
MATQKITFQLIDIHGKVKLTATLTPNQKQIIDISSLASGIYVARVEYNGKWYEKKLLKLNFRIPHAFIKIKTPQ